LHNKQPNVKNERNWFSQHKEKADKMAKKEKPLCKWKENDISKKFDKFADIVRNPKFVCKKCGRVADTKK